MAWLNDEISFKSHVALVQKVIITTLRTRGRGDDNDPVRLITQIWTLDGKLIAEVDDWRVE
jgi:hypothetical protein